MEHPRGTLQWHAILHFRGKAENAEYPSSKGSKLLSEGQLLIQCASWPSFPNTWHHFCIFQLKLDSPPPHPNSYLSKALGKHQNGVFWTKHEKNWRCEVTCAMITAGLWLPHCLPCTDSHIIRCSPRWPARAYIHWILRSMTDLVARGQTQTNAGPPRSPDCHRLL